MSDIPSRLSAALADRYRFERELGRGGMATVYLARELRHNRLVALKVLHPELAAMLGPERFLREIKLAARLQHPHILTLLDSGEAEGLLWYTMPYVEGESLRDRLEREQQLPIGDALRITADTALALDYAHRHGVVHRDVKPENILLSDGQALVADFGLAHALEQGSDGKLTETGLSVGTPAYMSPEQASGGSVDARSDIYALGCVLYEILAGEPPYSGPTPQAIIAKRVLEPVPRLRTLRESVPEAVEQAVTRALAKAPADRFATAAEFAQALAQPVATPTMNIPTAPQPKAGGRRRVPAGLAMLAIGVLLGLGVLLAWLRTRPETGTSGLKRLAVLPFDNLGRPEDAYFADGLAEEVRGKLAALPGLEVIASTSSGQYKGTSKPSRQIAQELGVRYLLLGRVRWEREPGGVSRVRVVPELVEVAARSSPTTKWQQPIEAPLTDVFSVQADIAARVAEALGVALGEAERERLAKRPTENLAAYEAFLRGNHVSEDLTNFELVALQRARDYYESAVALDPGFALAWAYLSRAHASIYWLTPTVAEAKGARRAAERALALAPGSPEGYLALGDYYSFVPKDPARALEQYTRGRQLAPKDARLLNAVASIEHELWDFKGALAHYQEAQVLDPRSVLIPRNMVDPLICLRRYPEALASATRAVALSPGNLEAIHTKVVVHLAMGDLARARAALRAVPEEVDPAALVAHTATYEDLYWVLDEEQQHLLVRLSPGAFGHNRAIWAIVRAQTYHLWGKENLARVYADSARMASEGELGGVPRDPQAHASLGLALAYLGRKAEAVREGKHAVALMPRSQHATLRSYFQHQLVRIYLLVGERERALDDLEQLVKAPYWLTPGWLRVDPEFATLRGNPRFQRLVASK